VQRRWWRRPFDVPSASSATVAKPARPILTTETRFYVLDGGRLEFANMGAFCDTGENEGKPGTLAVPCYLIRHGGSWMLWDTGLGDRIAALPHGEMHWLALHGTTNARIATCSDRPQTRRHRVCRSVPPARRSHRQHRPVSKRDVHRSVVRSLVGSRKDDARRGFRISNTPARTREGTIVR